MPRIAFPNVPDTLGVPKIPRSPNFPPVVQSVLGLAQGALYRALEVSREWGIYDKDGNLIADPSRFPGVLGVAAGVLGGATILGGSLGATLSVGSFEFSKEMHVSNFPVEGGRFANYNKVELPATPTLIFNFSGTRSERKIFIDTIDAAVKSTDGYDIQTPEAWYRNYSLTNYGYRRTNVDGAYMYKVAISLAEIREVSAQYTTANAGNIGGAKDPGSVPPVDGGKTQPKVPETSTLNKLIEGGTNLINSAIGG